MSFFEVIVVGIALSADAFAVTVSDASVYCHESRGRLLLAPLFFGAFQGLMPLLGYCLGGLAVDEIEAYSGVVTLAILGVIGGNMVREGLGALRLAREDPVAAAAARACGTDRLSIPTLLLQSVATAVDAFAVGVSLRAEGVDILPSSLVIAATTAACCVAALVAGRRLGRLLGDWAEVAGGVVLVLIGIGAMLP